MKRTIHDVEPFEQIKALHLEFPLKEQLHAECRCLTCKKLLSRTEHDDPHDAVSIGVVCMDCDLVDLKRFEKLLDDQLKNDIVIKALKDKIKLQEQALKELKDGLLNKENDNQMIRTLRQQSLRKFTTAQQQEKVRRANIQIRVIACQNKLVQQIKETDYKMTELRHEYSMTVLPKSLASSDDDSDDDSSAAD